MVKSNTVLLGASSFLNPVYDFSAPGCVNPHYGAPKLWHRLLCTFDFLLYECIVILSKINF